MNDIQDPYLWLEEVDSAEALDWVERHNSVTLDLIQSRPRYAKIFERNVEILTRHDRIAWPHVHGDQVINFWQDETHERGILRSMAFADWMGGAREWTTLLDVDALAAADGVHWVFKGQVWAPLPSHRVLVMLSRGGADSVEVREFDVDRRAFVEDGFFVPDARTSVAWLDDDTILVGSDFGEGTVTRSGYARTIRRWTRGTRLEDAPVIFHGDAKDLGVFVGNSRSVNGSRAAIYRSLAMFSQEVYLIHGDELVRVDVPHDAQLRLLNDRIILHLRSAWAGVGESWEADTVLDLSVEEYLAGRREFRLVVAPEPRCAIDAIAATSGGLVVLVLRNVSPELRRYRKVDGRWQGERIDLTGHGSVEFLDASPDWDGFLFSYSDPLQPTTLYEVDPGSTVPKVVERQAPRFEAGGHIVERGEATSADGTRIPYFLIRPEATDGPVPTVLYGYGGYSVSVLPTYSPIRGADWLERGGAFVIANIRGGGEFGTAWHTAALRENRQRSFDDFVAVAEDLIGRGITSPRHLGVMGGSNGGLLVGAVITQRPELFAAAVATVPVLDLRRYHKLLAGPNWLSEYGDPDKSEDWAFIAKYSPYHNLRGELRYPRTLFVTSTRDDRVHPAHARKMTARMEELGHDVLFFENIEGGHAAATGPTDAARQSALIFEFFEMVLAEGALDPS